MTGTEHTDQHGDGASIKGIALGEKLGQGMMGAVYKGSDETGQEVAVKLLHPQLATDDLVVASFVRERQLLGGLVHPNVVQIRDLAVESHQLGIVMEYVNGGTLRKLMEQGRVEPERAADVVSEIMAGLAAVHDLGVVHRDLKPENILLQEDGPGGEALPKIADFGLSRLVGGSSTKLSSTAGTALYISPEAVDRGKVGSAADVYAVGAMLFELLSGEPPFTGDDPMPIMLAHSQTAPPRLSGLPEQLVELVDSMLAKDPNRRPPASEVRTKLTALKSELGAYTSAQVSTLSTSSPGPGETVYRGTRLERGQGPLLSSEPPTKSALPVNSMQQISRSPLDLWDNRRVRTGASAFGVLLVALAGTLLFLRPWAGEQPADENIAYTFSPELYDNGLVVTRQWQFDPESADLTAVLSLHNTNETPLAAGSHFEVFPAGLATSLADVQFTPTPDQLLIDEAAARFDYISLGSSDARDITYVVSSVEGIAALDDLEQLAAAQAAARRAFVDQSEEEVPEASELELIGISFEVEKFELQVGDQSIPLQLTGEMSDGSKAEGFLLAQASLNVEAPDVAFIDTNGQLKAMRAGETTARAQVGGLEALAEVVVVNSDETPDIAGPSLDTNGSDPPSGDEDKPENEVEPEVIVDVVPKPKEDDEPVIDDPIEDPPPLSQLTASDLGTGHWRISAPDGDRCAIATWTIKGPDGATNNEQGDPGAGQCYSIDHALWTGRHYSSELTPGSYTVTLALTSRSGVSAGPVSTSFEVAEAPEPGITMPDLSGIARDDAVLVLSGVGLQRTSFKIVESTLVPEGAVLSTDPPAGSTVSTDDVVELTIATAHSVQVPDVVGLTWKEAQDLWAFRKIGLRIVRVDVELQPGDPRAGTITGTDPAAGALLPYGSTIRLTIGIAPTTTTDTTEPEDTPTTTESEPTSPSSSTTAQPSGP